MSVLVRISLALVILFFLKKAPIVVPENFLKPCLKWYSEIPRRDIISDSDGGFLKSACSNSTAWVIAFWILLFFIVLILHNTY